MKRNYRIPFLFIILCGVLSVSTWAQQRSLSQAADIARRLQFNTPQFVKQELMPVGGNLVSIRIGKNKSNSRRMPSFAIADRQPFYIFANEEQGGFVIVAGDERLGDVLGYSETSVFDISNMPDGMADLLLFYAHAYAVVQDEYSAPSYVNKAFSWTAVTPLVKTQWGQASPYNAWCPMSNGTRTVTGCGATAMAQVMKKWNYPVSGHGSLSYTTLTDELEASFNYDVNSFDWNEMRNAYSLNESASEVAKLMYACGVSIAMDYTPECSFSNMLDIAYSLIHVFDYANAVNYVRDYYMTDEWMAIIQRELSAGRPIVYRGADSTDESGHIFVVDGVNSTGKLHVNWGWDGYFDGYFKLDNFMPNNNDLRYGHWMVAKISPEENDEHEDIFYAEAFRVVCEQNEWGDKYMQLDIDNVYCYSNVACLRDQNTKFTGMIGVALYDLQENFVSILCSADIERNSFGCISNIWWKKYNSNLQIDDGVYILRPIVYSFDFDTVTPIRTLGAWTDKYYLIVENGDIQVSESLPDGISSIKNTRKANSQTYMLDGRRLSSTPQRGMYIRDGKKYMAR